MEANISVIVPLYHGKKYINEIVEMMVANLDHCSKVKYRIELIFVNDFPEEFITDADIPNTAVDKKKLNIRLIINEKNEGIHYSRVNGLRQAIGEYIMFFDQDDKIGDDYFESQLKHIHNGDVVVANGVEKKKYYDKLLYRYWFMHLTVKHIWFYAKYDCRIISPGQCLIRKASIPVIWQTQILKNNGADDYGLWLTMLTTKNIFKINRNKLYIHMYTEANTSLDNEKMSKSVYELLERYNKYIEYKSISLIKKRMELKNKSLLISIIERLNRKN